MLRIAVSMLVNDSRKYIGIVMGLAFTSFMMALQPATFIGLIAASASAIDETAGVDLWVMPSGVKTIDGAKPMQDQQLFRVRGIDGVASASPLFKGASRIRLPDGDYMPCTLIGVDEASFLGGPQALASGRLSDLRRNGTILVDEASGVPGGRLALVMAGPNLGLAAGNHLQIEGETAEIVGLHRGASSVDPSPVLYVGYRSIRRYVSDDKTLYFILVQLKPGADAATVAADITRFTGLAAHTGAAFKMLTFNYLLWETGSYVSFGVITLIVFVIGSSIAAQSFAAFSRDNLRYFGLLKAMGASALQLRGMILAQALVAAALGFGVGIGTMAAFGAWLRDGLGIGFSFALPWALIVFSAASVHLVCLASAYVSIRRVLRLDPAIVFRV
jgi:putative ABC transport system permease protein